MLADMATQLESARLLCYRAVTLLENGFPRRYESSMAKLAAAEAAEILWIDLCRLHGGIGYMESSPISWLYRLGRRFSIAGGTTEIHKNGLAHELLRQYEHGIGSLMTELFFVGEWLR